MHPSSIATLVLTAAGAASAWAIGGRGGAGVLAGVLLGSAIGLAAAMYQRYLVESKPALVLPVSALSFLVKLFAIVGFTVFFRYVEFAAARVDWRHFLASFALTSVCLLLTSAPASARALKLR